MCKLLAARSPHTSLLGPCTVAPSSRPVRTPQGVCVSSTPVTCPQSLGDGDPSQTAGFLARALLLFSVMGPATLSSSVGVRCPRGRPRLNVPPPLSGSDPVPPSCSSLSTLLSRSVCRESVCEVGCLRIPASSRRVWIVWAWCRLAGEKSGSLRPQHV